MVDVQAFRNSIAPFDNDDMLVPNSPPSGSGEWQGTVVVQVKLGCLGAAPAWPTSNVVPATMPIYNITTNRTGSMGYLGSTRDTLELLYHKAGFDGNLTQPVYKIVDPVLHGLGMGRSPGSANR